MREMRRDLLHDKMRIHLLSMREQVMTLGCRFFLPFCVVVVVVISSCSLAVKTDTSVYYLFPSSP